MGVRGQPQVILQDLQHGHGAGASARLGPAPPRLGLHVVGSLGADASTHAGDGVHDEADERHPTESGKADRSVWLSRARWLTSIARDGRPFEVFQ
jgi:hypothetical protein